MPKIIPPAPSSNGHTGSSPLSSPPNKDAARSEPTSVDRRAALDSRIEAAFNRATTGTDEVTIGNAEMEVPADLVACTMSTVATLVAGVRYLLRNYIPFGMVTGIVAEPGVGKSAFVLWLAFIVMTGRTWFTSLKGPKPGYVLWCPTENDMAITLQRMRDWGIPLKNLILPFKDDPLCPVNLTSDEHLAFIEAFICKYRTKLVVIDSLRNGHDGDENSSRVGKVLQSLAAIAERTGAAIVVVHHTRKLIEGEEVCANSSRGSNAILAMMRSQIGLDRPDPGSRWVRVRVLKENLGIAPPPIGFQVTKQGLEFGPAPEKPEKDTQKQKATDWLRDYLADGDWHLAQEVLTDAAQFSFSKNAIQRAREDLCITLAAGYVRKRDDAKYEWKLPQAEG